MNSECTNGSWKFCASYVFPCSCDSTCILLFRSVNSRCTSIETSPVEFASLRVQCKMFFYVHNGREMRADEIAAATRRRRGDECTMFAESGPLVARFTVTWIHPHFSLPVYNTFMKQWTHTGHQVMQSTAPVLFIYLVMWCIFSSLFLLLFSCELLSLFVCFVFSRHCLLSCQAFSSLPLFSSHLSLPNSTHFMCFVCGQRGRRIDSLYCVHSLTIFHLLSPLSPCANIIHSLTHTHIKCDVDVSRKLCVASSSSESLHLSTAAAFSSSSFVFWASSSPTSRYPVTQVTPACTQWEKERERERCTQQAKVNGWKLHLSVLAFWPSSMTLLICRYSDTRPRANDFSSNLHFSVTQCGWCVTFFPLPLRPLLSPTNSYSFSKMYVREKGSQLLLSLSLLFCAWSSVSVRGREKKQEKRVKVAIWRKKKE